MSYRARRRVEALEAASVPERRLSIFVHMSGHDYDRLISQDCTGDECACIWARYGVGPLGPGDVIDQISIEIPSVGGGEAAQITRLRYSARAQLPARADVAAIDHRLDVAHGGEPTSCTAADLPAPGIGRDRPAHWVRPSLPGRAWDPDLQRVVTTPGRHDDA